MFKLFSITLSLVILLQNLGFSMGVLVQVDEFIEHAQFHSEKYGDNVFVFMSKHYGELKADHEKKHKEEKGDHEQLPFHHASHVLSGALFLLNTVAIEFKTAFFSKATKSKFYYQAPSSSIYSEGLFQPPRLS